MRALNIKLVRDLRRLWAQALAIALVLAAGIATMILATGAYQSLYNTRAHYYATHRFPDLFADATRVPYNVAADIATLEGVVAVEPRIAKIAVADIEGMIEPATLLLISLPDHGEPRLNRLVLRRGRLPDSGAAGEVVISEGFGIAHGLWPGAQFHALVNGVRRTFRVSGWALSPEFIYAIGPGDLMPDEARYGIVWLRERELAAAFDLRGSFSNLLVKLLPGTNEAAVISQIDLALARYGGRGATGRKYQLSHAFLDSELKQLRAMGRVLPPIFLIVAAFLVNMTLSRLIALEREQIGLLKAMGYSSWAVARHYIAFVAAIALIGAVIGIAMGWWLGTELAQLYARFFKFPLLIFSRDPSMYLLSVAVAFVAAIAGAMRAALLAARLSPATAMAPPSPPLFRKLLQGGLRLPVLLRQHEIMNLRHLAHWPWRTASGILGVALAVSVLVGSLWSFGSVNAVVDITFNRLERQDASIHFPGNRTFAALYAVARLPGVMRAEPFRNEDVEISYGHKHRRIALTGRPQDSDLTPLLNQELQRVALPREGLVISVALARALDVGSGEHVTLTFLSAGRRTVAVPVSAIIEGYFGLSAYMDLESLNRLLRQGNQVSGVNITFDQSERTTLLRDMKDTPATRFVVFQQTVREKFRATLAENIFIMMSVYVALAALIAFGVIYNFARVSLSESGRELASLRVLGFSRGEVSAILISEMAIIVIIAQPMGWLIGTGFAHLMVRAFSSELYRIPLVIGREVYAYASLVIIVATFVSVLIVNRRIGRLDLVEVLKTRE